MLWISNHKQVHSDQRPLRTHAVLFPGTRVLLLIFSALTLLGLVVLFGRPGHTADFFAWTIKPPLTAAFLGAGYGSGCLLVAMSLRASHWPSVRVPLLTILAFTAVTLLATLMHLDKFHLHGSMSMATFAGWFWLFVYIMIPPGMLVIWWLQDRRVTIARTSPRIPRWLALVLAAQGAVMLVVGVALFVHPPSSQTLWPWTLTPLTARAVAAWLIAFGMATGYAAARERQAESRVQAMAYTLFGILELVALLRFSGTPDWDSAAAWVYLAFLLLITATGAMGVAVSRPARAATAATATAPVA